MAKILLFTVEDMAAPGIRCLASYILETSSHKPVLAFVERGTSEKHIDLSEVSQKSWDDNINFAGFKQFAFNSGREPQKALPDSFWELCNLEKPDIIGFSTRFCEERFGTFFNQIKLHASPPMLIAGGHGPSVNPRQFLEWGCDVVVRGEGEETIRELADAFENNTSWKNIRNLAWLDESNQIVKNPLRSPIEDLSTMPIPLRQREGIYHIINKKLIKGDLPYESNAFSSMMLAGRGCVGSCAYCAAPLWRDIYTSEGHLVPKHRKRTNAHIISEAKQMKNNGAHSILFMDDFFIRPYEEMKEFFKLWKTQIGLPLFIHPHLEQFRKHPDLFDDAIEAGLTISDLAVQSGDEQLCKKFFHRNNNNKAVLEFQHKAYDHYLPIMTEFIDGYKFPNHDDLDAKLDFIKNLPPFDPAYKYGNTISVMKLIIHPGSKLAETFPNPEKILLSSKEFIYRAMLLHYRLLLDDEKFSEIRANKDFKENPISMYPAFLKLIYRLNLKYIKESAKALSGKRVWFYGCADVYKKWKNIFAASKPLGILLDYPPDLKYLDGLPVLHPKEALKNHNERLPIICFSANAMIMARKIKLLRPDYQRTEIIAVEG